MFLWVFNVQDATHHVRTLLSVQPLRVTLRDTCTYTKATLRGPHLAEWGQREDKYTTHRTHTHRHTSAAGAHTRTRQQIGAAAAHSSLDAGRYTLMHPTQKGGGKGNGKPGAGRDPEQEGGDGRGRRRWAA